MFWRRYEPSSDAVPPRWREPLARVARIVAGFPARASIAPDLVAHDAGLELPATLALLHALERRGEGELVFRLIDDGREFSDVRYRHKADIPREAENEFGDRLDVAPENVELVYEVVPQVA